MVNSFIRCCCGTGCATCWMAISVWAFLFVGILGILLATDKQGNIGIEDGEDPHALASLCGFTVLIYVILFFLCGFNLWWRRRHPWPPKEDEDVKKEQFSAIGPVAK